MMDRMWSGAGSAMRRDEEVLAPVLPPGPGLRVSRKLGVAAEGAVLRVGRPPIPTPPAARGDRDEDRPWWW
jgi:hypothetical protein